MRIEDETMNSQGSRTHALLMWLGSYVTAGLLLFFYFKAPLLPILLNNLCFFKLSVIILRQGPGKSGLSALLAPGPQKVG